MRREKVKPTKKGNIVLDDLGRAIPDDGAEVNFTTLISRSIKEGDLEIVKGELKKAATDEPKKETKKGGK